MTTCFAEELTGPEFSAFVTDKTIGVLPVAAIEPHGPHLPLSTDCDIARGHLASLADLVPGDIDVLVLPLQIIGHSVEHQAFAGTFSHDAEILLASWTAIARTFHRAGGRKLVFVSSHGGNSDVVGLLTGRLRAELSMLAVSAAWLRFGQPEGLFDAGELAYGIHGGAVETALMLHYWPDAVRREALADYPSAASIWDEGTDVLKSNGRTRLGWMSQDLNPAGVVGNGLLASAEKGAASARHALAGFVHLLAEVDGFDLAWLRHPA